MTPLHEVDIPQPDLQRYRDVINASDPLPFGGADEIVKTLTGEGLWLIMLKKDGRPYCHDGPAIVRLRPDGSVLALLWARGVLHNPDGPTRLVFHPTGAIAQVSYTNERGLFHRTDGPAHLEFSPDGTQVRSDTYHDGHLISSTTTRTPASA